MIKLEEMPKLGFGLMRLPVIELMQKAAERLDKA